MRGAALAGALTERLRYSGPAQCPLCDADGERCTQDGQFYIFCERTHPTVHAGCEALHSTLLALLEGLTPICKARRAQTTPADTYQRVSVSACLMARAATAAHTTTLRSGRLSLSRIRRAPSHAHHWCLDARAPLASTAAACLRNSRCPPVSGAVVRAQPAPRCHPRVGMPARADPHSVQRKLCLLRVLL
jgi:hypothetical protein